MGIRTILALIAASCISVHADVVFSADFEAGQVEAETGKLLFRHHPLRQVDATASNDPRLGNRLLLVDQETPPENALSLTWQCDRPVSLSSTTATVSFDYSARRTNGGTKTTMVTGWSRMGQPVFRFILGDNNAFGNMGSDRQRPGFETQLGGAQVLPEPGTPGAFWWGSDTDGNGIFNVSKDGHFELTIHSNSWDLTTLSQGGNSYSTSDLPSYDGQSHDDLALITIHTQGASAGGFWDNLRVAGTPVSATSTTALIAIDPEQLGQRIGHWGYDLKLGGTAERLTPEVAQDLFVKDGMNLLRLPIYGDDVVPAHPGPGQIILSDYAAHLNAITNALAANPELRLFASKKLQTGNSFPAWVKDADGNGTDDGNGIIPEKYAVMLADYLRFMEARNIQIHYLGIDNETEWNEGGITPEKYKDTIDALRELSSQAPAFEVPLLIGWEGFNPLKDWTTELNANGWGDRADLIGTHYYPSRRPTHRLIPFGLEVQDKEFWNTEVHWDKFNSRDIMNEAEGALGAVFDCIDNGMDGFAWWDYKRTGFKGELERALTMTTHRTRPATSQDLDGPATPMGTFVTRAFVSTNTIHLWIMNNQSSVTHPRQRIRLSTGSITTNAMATHYTEAVNYDESLTLMGNGELEVSTGRRSISLITIPYEPRFIIQRITHVNEGQFRVWVQCPRLNEPYHLLESTTPEGFIALPDSTFTPSENPTVLELAHSDHDPFYLKAGTGPSP